MLRQRSHFVRQKTTNILSVKNFLRRPTGRALKGTAIKQLTPETVGGRRIFLNYISDTIHPFTKSASHAEKMIWRKGQEEDSPLPLAIERPNDPNPLHYLDEVFDYLAISYTQTMISASWCGPVYPYFFFIR